MQQRFSSVTQALDALGFGPFHYLLWLYTGLAWAADAMETMILSYLGPAVACTWPGIVTPAAQSWLTSIVFCGMLFGVYTLGAISDVFGRRKGFLVSAAMLGGLGLASAAAPTFHWLLFFRGLVGFALGGTPIAVTLFAEFLPSENRGKWLLGMQFWWSIGTAFEAVLAWMVLPTLGWRWLLALSAFPLVPLTLLYPWLPESPHWLVAKKRYTQAEAVLKQVARLNVEVAEKTNDGPCPEMPFVFDLAGPQEAASPLNRNNGDTSIYTHNTNNTTNDENENGTDDEDVLLNKDSGPSIVIIDGPFHGSTKGGRVLLEEERTSLLVPSSSSSTSTTAAVAVHRSHANSRDTKRALSDGAHDHSLMTHSLPPSSPINHNTAPAAVVGTSVSFRLESESEASSPRLESSRRKMGSSSESVAVRVMHAVHVLSSAMRILLGQSLRRATLTLWIIWFANAFLYYGLVLLTTALQTSPDSSQQTYLTTNNTSYQDRDICLPNGGVDFGAKTYAAVVITTAAEAPGLIAAAFMVDSIGRRWTIRCGLIICTLSLISLFFSLSSSSSSSSPLSSAALIFPLFVSRAAIEGTFSCLYIYTPETYPTAVRSIGLAVCNGLGRIGGLLAPFATVYLVEQGLKQEAVMVLGIVAGVAAAAAAFGLPHETKGRDLHLVQDGADEEDN